MSRSRRLRSLADLAKTDEEYAAQALGECQRRLDEQTGRLEELRSYRCEYLSQVQGLARSGLEVESIQRYRIFVAKLDESIVLQERLVEGLAEECQAKKRDWSLARAKHKSLDKAVTRQREAEARRLDRREQERSDEGAAARYICTGEDD